MQREQGDINGYCGVVTSETDWGDITKTALRRCVHCGYMWAVVRGSGKLRGFCTSCMGYVCGRAWCVAHGCVHEDQALANLEAGLLAPEAYSTRPIVGSVPIAIPRG